MQTHELREFLLENVPMDMIDEMQYWEEIKAFRDPQKLLWMEEEAAKKRKEAIESFERLVRGKDLTFKDQVKLIEKIACRIYSSEYPEEKRGPIYEALLERLCPEIEPGDWKRCLTR